MHHSATRKSRQIIIPLHYGPGYRIYFVLRERVVVVLLCGGDKSTQRKDIRKAKALAAELDAQ